MSEEITELAKEIAELRIKVREWSETADRLLIMEDHALPVAVRRLLNDIAEVVL